MTTLYGKTLINWCLISNGEFTAHFWCPNLHGNSNGLIVYDKMPKVAIERDNKFFFKSNEKKT